MDLSEAKKDCICEDCPTYINCKELAFCFSGKSKCIKKKVICICGECPVHLKMDFKKLFYCLDGKE
jgi:hypothetical protein